MNSSALFLRYICDHCAGPGHLRLLLEVRRQIVLTPKGQYASALQSAVKAQYAGSVQPVPAAAANMAAFRRAPSLSRCAGETTLNALAFMSTTAVADVRVHGWTLTTPAHGSYRTIAQ